MDRLTRERQLHNNLFSDLRRSRLQKIYSGTNRSFQVYEERLRAFPAGTRVLDYGCGRGDSTLFLARLGFQVTAIDISDTAIETARGRMQEAGLDSATFLRMNAEKLEFDDGRFDLVCGRGILHHLDLEAACGEIRRVLRPGGRALFIEPLGHNPAINLFRRLTPTLRTPDEHPLLVSDLNFIGARFRALETQYFHLMALAGMVLPPLRKVLETLDDLTAEHIPPLRRFFWQVILDMHA